MHLRGEDRSAVSAGGSGVLLCVGQRSAEPRQLGPFVITSANGNGQAAKDGQWCRKAYRANHRGNCCLPVPKYPLMCLRPLPTEAWYPPKSAIDEWLATMI